MCSCCNFEINVGTSYSTCITKYLAAVGNDKTVEVIIVNLENIPLHLFFVVECTEIQNEDKITLDLFPKKGVQLLRPFLGDS